MKRKIRWELLFFDSLVYLLSALFIFVFYPSALFRLSFLQVAAYTLFGWICVTGSRFAFHLYQKIWRYAGQADYISLMIADGIATVIFTLVRGFIPNTVTFVRGLSLFTINLLGCIVIRMIYQWIYQGRARDSRIEKFALRFLKLTTGTSFADEKKSSNRIKIAIIGAGSVGAMLADELKQNPRATYEPVCFVDVDAGKVGREVYGVPVLASTAPDLSDQLSARGVQEVVFALPNVPAERREELYKIYREYGYKIKAYDYPEFGGEKAKLHDIKIEDLLFRSAQDFLTEEVKDYISNTFRSMKNGQIHALYGRKINQIRTMRGFRQLTFSGISFSDRLSSDLVFC